MPNKKQEWIEISRRGTAQPLLVIDAVLHLYKEGMFATAHHRKWGPKAYRQFDNARWFTKDDLNGYRNFLIRNEEKQKGYLLKNALEYQKRITTHRKFIDQHRGDDFANMTNQQLINVFMDWFEITKQFWCFAYDYIFINKYLPEEVVSAVEKVVPDRVKQNEYFVILFTADALSEIWMEKKSMLNIAFWIQKNKVKMYSPQLKKKIQKHLEDFAHLGFYYFRGEAYTIQTIKKRLREYSQLSTNDFASAQEDIKKQQRNESETKKVTKKLKLDPQTIHNIRIIKRWGALSNYVDETYSYAVHQLWGLWTTIAKRLGGLTIREFASFTAEETVKNLKNKKTFGLKKESIDRLKDHAYVFENGNSIKMYTGKNLKKYRRQQAVKKVNYQVIKELRGQAASLGRKKGMVRVVYSMHDLKKVERGSIMVTDATNPTYVPAMERASAIITDEGGLLSHAAIVSRELRVPCVVGTKIATKVLNDGDMVEVNADKGIIKKL